MDTLEMRGQLVTRLREEKLWTRERLAIEAGVSPSTVTHAEEGITNLRLGTIGRLAQALGVDPQVLLHPEEAEILPKSEGPSAVELSLLDGPGHNFLALGVDGNLKDARRMSVPSILVRLQDLSEERNHLRSLRPVEMGMPNPRARKAEIRGLRSPYTRIVMELLSLAAKKAETAKISEAQRERLLAEIEHGGGEVLQEPHASAR